MDEGERQKECEDEREAEVEDINVLVVSLVVSMQIQLHSVMMLTSIHRHGSRALLMAACPKMGM